VTETTTTHPDTGDLSLVKKRRPKGELERQVREVIDAFVMEEIDFKGKPVTAHRVASEVLVRYPEQKRPTAGSVSAVFDRWVEIGAAIMDVKPLQFVGYTMDASELGFKELTERFKRGELG